MSVTATSCRVIVLVKALPQPSKKYGETVCCAGVTPDRNWKRLYPIRYRHLSGDSAFKRWDIIDFRYRAPRHDRREESCAVEENSIEIVGRMPKRERVSFFHPLIFPSIASAIQNGRSLALIRPTSPCFIYRPKSASQIAAERAAYKRAAGQGSLLDRKLAEMEPSPYVFKFRFKDAERGHTFTNGDWETHAMYYFGRQRGLSDSQILEWMAHTFNVEYPKHGMVFAVGNMAKRPHVWQLLGVLKLAELDSEAASQTSLF